MPAKSRKQQKFLFATKGARWVRRHGFNRMAKKRRRRRRRRTNRRRR